MCQLHLSQSHKPVKFQQSSASFHSSCHSHWKGEIGIAVSSSTWVIKIPPYVWEPCPWQIPLQAGGWNAVYHEHSCPSHALQSAGSDFLLLNCYSAIWICSLFSISSFSSSGRQWLETTAHRQNHFCSNFMPLFWSYIDISGAISGRAFCQKWQKSIGDSFLSKLNC